MANILNKPVDIFFRKMFYTYLTKIPTLQGNSIGFLENIKSYSNKIFHQDIEKYFVKKEKFYLKTLKEDKNWIIVASYIKDKEIAELKVLIEKHHPEIVKDFEISDNINFLGDLLNLSKNERLLLQFYSHITDTGPLPSAYSYTFSSISNMGALAEQYEAIFNINATECKKILSHSTNLLSSGILFVDESYNFKNHYNLNEKIEELVNSDNLNHDVIERVLFPSNLDTDLHLEDFHQKDEIDIMGNIINSSFKTKNKGINVLLWGVPGTGKTELSLILAKKYGWELKVIGDISEAEDSEKSRDDRLFCLKIAQKLFKKQNKRKIVLLFDEMEDLFKIDLNANFSKAFINRTIEKTTIPIIWTTNDLHDIGSSAVLRRMTYAINFKVPPVDARRVIWKKYTDKYELNIPEDIVEDLAVDFDVVPALIANAARVVNLSKVPNEDIYKILSNLDTAMNFGRERELGKRKKERNQYKFEVGLSNANLSLDSLIDKILESKNQNFSMCLYGPPGTGKSAFARHLAERMKMKVMFKRASDLLSMWVGENEKNIADMFRDADKDKKFLILDEADSFLESRQNAVRSWEVSKVNEMLTHMEFHPMPFVATTNLLENLDEASLRRFTFKIKFDFLRRDQIADIFHFYFDALPHNIIYELETLTPGDFANVKKKAAFLNITDSFEISMLLREECEFKPQHKNPIGFGVEPMLMAPMEKPKGEKPEEDKRIAASSEKGEKK